MIDGHLNFDTRIDQKGFNNGVKGLSKSLDSVKGKLLGIGAAIGAAFSVQAIQNFSKEAKQLWNTQLEAKTKLETVMRQRLKATAESTDNIKQYASAQQEIGIIGDEIKLAGAQQIATFLNETDSLKSLIPAMNNLLAQQKGINATASDAVSIGNLMGKVMQGQTSALTRVGVTFSEAEERILRTCSHSRLSSK